MINILYLDAHRNFIETMDRTRYNYLVTLSNHQKVTLYIDGPEFENFISYVASIMKFKPDLIICNNLIEIPGWKNLKDYKIPIIKFFNETFDIENIKKEIVNYGLSLAVFHHPECIEDFKDLFNICKFRGLQHRIESEFFKELKLEKEYDILLVGCTAVELYPLRNKLLNMIKEGKFSKWRTKILEHPGYKIQNSLEQSQNYISEINKSKIVFGCSSIYKYPLSKYIEIPACGALMAADIPNYKEEFFKEIGIELNIKWSDKKIIETIEYWLTHEIEFLEKLNNAYNLIHSEYTNKQYIEQFLEIIEETKLLTKISEKI